MPSSKNPKSGPKPFAGNVKFGPAVTPGQRAYDARIKRAMDRGFSRVQARGKTAGTGQLSIGEINALPNGLGLHRERLIKNKDKNVKFLAEYLTESAKENDGLIPQEEYETWRELEQSIGLDSAQIREDYQLTFGSEIIQLEGPKNRVGTIINIAPIGSLVKLAKNERELRL